MITSGLHTYFDSCLEEGKPAELLYETCWSITNISAGSSEYTKAIIDTGIVPRLVSLLSCEDGDVRVQSAWALGNIAGDCGEYRDLVLDMNMVESLIGIVNGLEAGKEKKAKHVVVWVLGNLCRYKHFNWNKVIFLTFPHSSYTMHILSFTKPS